MKTEMIMIVLKVSCYSNFLCVTQIILCADLKISYSSIAITTPTPVYDMINKQQNNTLHDPKGELKEINLYHNNYNNYDCANLKMKFILFLYSNNDTNTSSI